MPVITVSAPNQYAVRMIVPRLPGSFILSRAIIRFELRISGIETVGFLLTTAMIPCEFLVSVSFLN